LAALVGAIEDWVMLRLQLRGSLDGHRAAHVAVRVVDLLRSEFQRPQQVESGSVHLLSADAELRLDEVIANRPAIEDKRQFERARQLRLDPLEHLVGEALCLESRRVDMRAALERASAPAVADDVVDLPRGVAEALEGRRYGGVDDLEVTTAREFLELDQREV